jgi:DNA-binding NtrC family response regulator
MPSPSLEMTEKRDANGTWAKACRGAFDPSRSLRELLDALLSGPLRSLRPPGLLVCLRDPAAQEQVATWTGEQVNPPDLQACRRCLFDTSTADCNTGEMNLERLPCHPAAGARIGHQERVGFVTGRPADLPRLHQIAHAVADLAERLEMNRRFKARFGRDCWLLGGSENLIRLDAFLKQTAEVALPVLLYGAPGTGRGDAARSIHLLGNRRDRHFVEVDGSALTDGRFAAELRAASAEADGGTLFLAAVDEMEVHLQSRLAGILNSGFGQWWKLEGPTGEPNVRVVASAHAADPNQPAIFRLHPGLRDELAFLSFELDPLSYRAEDIDLLAQYFLRTYSAFVSLPDPLRTALRSYGLPGNILELRRIMARLGAFMSQSALTGEDLRRYAPELVAGPGAPRPTARIDELAQICARGRYAAGEGARVHPVLERALAHISEEFVRTISLASLARAALVSPSHLSHLFKDQLGLSPLGFLTLVRIEQAKLLFAQETVLSITLVAERSGFGDLRHFERQFKRLVGMNPKDFRNRHVPRSQAS